MASKSHLLAVLRIRIHFLQIRIQLFFSMWTWIQLQYRSKKSIRQKKAAFFRLVQYT